MKPSVCDRKRNNEKKKGIHRRGMQIEIKYMKERGGIKRCGNSEIAGKGEGSIFRPLYQQQVTRELNTKSSGMV
jgi:hypothetical protein